MKKTKHQVQNLAKLKGSADAKKIWYAKTYLFMCELKQNGKRVVNDIMLLTAWLCQLLEHKTDEQTIIYVTKSIEV